MSEDISEVPTPEQAQEDISDIPIQDQPPSVQSTNILVPLEGNSNDQPHRITKWTRSHPQTQIIGDPSNGVKTRATVKFCLFTSFLGMIELNVSEILEDPFWIEAMHDELLQFEINRI